METLVGQKLGRYTVVEHIGAGGMGVVFRAHDEHLSRDVALKLLPSGVLADAVARSRFRAEALALAKLNHPNIATLFDFDSHSSTDFLVIEYIPGETLDAVLKRGRIEEAEAVRYAEQLAAGLASAHKSGVLHRDLKPANLRINGDGLLKILDFGLAKLIRIEDTVSSTTTQNDLLKNSGTAGTLPYMAPEQLQRGELDERTDIYGAGAVLYEMACGSRAFPQVVPSVLIADVLGSVPVAPRSISPISAQFETIILKCLEKSPSDRFQNANELLEALHHVRSAPRRLVSSKTRRQSRAIDSLAVLPFKNETGTPDSDYLCEGLTEALINALSQLPDLKKVIARSSVYRYAKSDISPEQAGRELDVDSVLLGRLVKHGDNLRLSVEFIAVSDSRHIWGTQYNRRTGEISGLEQVIADEISTQLGTSLRPRKKAVSHASRSKAYDLYLRGRHYWYKRPASGMLQSALEFFERSAQADPNFALAHAGIADAYNTQGAWESGLLAPRAAFTEGKLAAERALALDPQLAEAHGAKAYAALHFEWDLDSARKGFEHCLQLNPNYVHGRHWYAHLLIAAGRMEDALAESRRIIQLDPFDPVINTHLPWHYWMVHDFSNAAESAEKAVHLEPNLHWAHFFAGLAYEQMQEFNRALDCLHRSVQFSGGSKVMRTAYAHALAAAGDHAAARRNLQELQSLSVTEYVSSFELGLIHLALNQQDEGWALLDRACDERSSWMPYLKAEPRLRKYQQDERFRTLLARVNLRSDSSAKQPRRVDGQ